MKLLERARAALSGRFQQGVLWNLGSLAVLGLSGFAMTSLIGRLYDEAALGQFNQVWFLYVFLSQAAVGGLDRSALRAIAEHQREPARIAAIAWGALLPALLSSVAVALALVLARERLAEFQQSPALAEGALAAAPGLCLFGINKILLGVVNGLQRMRAFALYQSLRYLAMPLGVLVCRALGLSGAQVPFLFTFAEGLLFAALALEFLLVVGPRWRGWREWTPLHLRYGLKSVVSGMILELNTRLDVWMLGYFLSSDATVGIYSLAIMVAEGVFQLITVLQNNYNPLLAQHFAAGRVRELEQLIARARRVAWLLVAGVAALAVLLYPLGAELLMDNADYRAGWAPFACVMAGVVLSAGWLPFNQALLMANRPGWHTLYMLSALLANFAGNALLIPRLGMLGAALATGASFLASIAVLRVICRRELGFRL